MADADEKAKAEKLAAARKRVRDKSTGREYYHWCIIIANLFV
jgi:hypothetical protein